MQQTALGACKIAGHVAKFIAIVRHSRGWQSPAERTLAARRH